VFSLKALATWFGWNQSIIRALYKTKGRQDITKYQNVCLHVFTCQYHHHHHHLLLRLLLLLLLLFLLLIKRYNLYKILACSTLSSNCLCSVLLSSNCLYLCSLYLPKVIFPTCFSSSNWSFRHVNIHYKINVGMQGQ